MAVKKKKGTVKKADSKKSKTKKVIKKKSPSSSKTKPSKKAIKKKQIKKKTSKKRGVDLECFLTTACVHYYGLNDNGHELNTLRQYRDHYLRSFPEGMRLIEEYGRVAPKIVTAIERDFDASSSYQFIYEKVKKACQEIEMSSFEAAQSTYIDLVMALQKKYEI